MLPLALALIWFLAMGAFVLRWNAALTVEYRAAAAKGDAMRRRWRWRLLVLLTFAWLWVPYRLTDPGDSAGLFFALAAAVTVGFAILSRWRTRRRSS